MQHVDIAIEGGVLVTPAGTVEATIGIVDGRIASIGERPSADETLDARGCFVLPGAVDPHVHLSRRSTGDGTSFVDDVVSGTRAALAGGVTCVGQMSFPGPEETMAEALAADAAALADAAECDYFLHPSVVHVPPDGPLIIRRLADDGHPSLKTTLFGLDAVAESAPGGAEALVATMVAAAAEGIVVLVHCEDDVLIRHRTEELVREGAAIQDYPRSRPVVTERASVERAIALAELTGARLYVVHLSSREALDAVRGARARGVDVLVETRPVYLFRTDADYRGAEPGRFVTMPPLRGAGDVEALWAGLADGTIDTIGSDHAPWMLAQKLDPERTIATLPKGIAELDTYLPLLFDRGVTTGAVSLQRLVEVTATNPASIFGLHDKGRLVVGADADVVVLDPDVVRTIDAAALQTRADYTVYDGERVRGWPRFVLGRGVVRVRDGAVASTAGGGRLVRRARTDRRSP